LKKRNEVTKDLISRAPEYIQDLGYTKNKRTTAILAKGNNRLIHAFQAFYINATTQRMMITEGILDTEVMSH